MVVWSVGVGEFAFESAEQVVAFAGVVVEVGVEETRGVVEYLLRLLCGGL